MRQQVKQNPYYRRDRLHWISFSKFFKKEKNIILLYSIQKKSKNLKKLKVSNTLNLISLLKESTKKLINNIFLM